MNTYYKIPKLMHKFFSVATSIALVALSFVPALSIPQTVEAASSIDESSIIITDINGPHTAPFNFSCPSNPLYNPVTVSGTATADAPPGNLSSYHVQILWGDGTQDDVTEASPFGVGNAKGIATRNFSWEHTYTADGPKDIKIRVYHENPNGNDNQVDSVITITTCVFVPPPNTGTLLVDKVVYGGDAQPGDFVLNVSNSSPTPSSFPGSSDQTPVLLTPGEYSITETPTADYDASYSSECSGTIAAGDTKLCTVSNTYNPAPPVLGCTDPDATNYNPDATEDDGSCAYPPVLGCTDPEAFNYNPNATQDDGSCVPVINGCSNPDAFNYDSEANTDDGSCIAVVNGCTDPDAFNYNPSANTDDGSCVAIVFGCTDPDAFNYNASANTDDGSCVVVVNGCTNPDAFNYNPEANTDDGSCVAVVNGCTDPEAFNYNPEANTDDQSCIPVILGCTDSDALNYNADANTNDSSCEYPPNEIPGCMDETATNFNPDATIDNDSCEYPPNEVPGCMDETATNFNPDATVNNDSCTYPSTPTPPPSNGGGSRSGDRNVNVGSVLGASTGQVLGESCGLYMDRFIRSGSRYNSSEQVTKLQTFLNKWMGSTLQVTGDYDSATLLVLKSFQEKYASEILTPWGLKSATGIVYLTTLREINLLECPELSLAIPPLVPWSKNPGLPKEFNSTATAPKSVPSLLPNFVPSTPTTPDTGATESVGESQSATVAEAEPASGGLWGFIKGLFGGN